MESKCQKVRKLIKTDTFKMPWRHVKDVFGFDDEASKRFYRDNLDPKYRSPAKR